MKSAQKTDFINFWTPFNFILPLMSKKRQFRKIVFKTPAVGLEPTTS